ncbi:oxo-acid lyase, partial [Salmonella enterica]
FPMGGEKSLPELYALATTAARHGMTLIEPTGGSGRTGGDRRRANTY